MYLKNDFHNTDPGILDGVKEIFGEGCSTCGRTDFLEENDEE